MPASVSGVSRRAVLLGALSLAGCSGPAQRLTQPGVVSWRGYAPSPYGQIHCYFAAPTQPVRRRPLVCLHQSPTSGISYAEFQQVMAQDRWVICPDTAGYGDSDGPATVPDIKDYSDALAAALEGLGLGPEGSGPIDLLGFHTGNFVALELAATRPELVNRLVMPGIPYYVPDERRTRLGRFAKPRPYFTDPDYVGTSYRRSVFEPNNSVSRLRRHELFVSRLLSGTQSHFGFDAVSRYDPDPKLRQLSQPVLLPILNETLAQPTRVASRLISEPTLRELPRLNGLSWYERPEPLAAAVAPFLQDRLPPASISVSDGGLGGTTASGVRRWRFYLPCKYGQLHCHAAEPAGGAPDRPPVVLLHQSPLSGAVFRRLQADLARDRLVICPDTPGFGNSSVPEQQPRMEDYGGALVDGLKALGFGQSGRAVDLFGFHTGSFVAAAAAGQAPAVFRRVILCGVPYYPAAERTKMQTRFLRPYAFLTDPDYVDDMWKQMIFATSVKADRDFQMQRFTARMRAGPKGEWGPRAVFAYDADRGLARITQPLLLLAFDEVMTEPTRVASRMLPNAAFEEISSLDMMGFATEPGVVAESIRRFLS